MRKILFILLFLCSLDLYSQNEFVKSFYSFKNPLTISTCIIANESDVDTLLIKLHVSTNIADTFHNYKFVKDTFLIDYGVSNSLIDTIYKNDSLGRKQIYALNLPNYSIYNRTYGYVFTYKFLRKEAPRIIKFNGCVLKTCSRFPVSYDSYKNDTINMVNSDGNKDGTWIEFYENGQIKTRKKYKNGIFIEGFEYDEKNNIIAKLIETSCTTYSIPMNK